MKKLSLLNLILLLAGLLAQPALAGDYIYLKCTFSDDRYNPKDMTLRIKDNVIEQYAGGSGSWESIYGSHYFGECGESGKNEYGDRSETICRTTPSSFYAVHNRYPGRDSRKSGEKNSYETFSIDRVTGNLTYEIRDFTPDSKVREGTCEPTSEPKPISEPKIKTKF